MPITSRKRFAKARTQRITKILLWLGAFVVLILSIVSITVSKNSATVNTPASSQTQDIEAHSAELSEEAERLESALNELQFDEDIQALRDQ